MTKEKKCKECWRKAIKDNDYCQECMDRRIKYREDSPNYCSFCLLPLKGGVASERCACD